MNRQLAMPLPRRLHPTKAAVLARRITPDWRDEAACTTAKDPDAWFPHPSTGWEFLAEPMTACAGCPVRRSCLAAALLGDEAGIWAGTDRTDRRPALTRLAAGGAVDLVLDELLYKARIRAKETA
jgi:hypothetical protein